MQTTRILILSDDRPGHFNLSEGIAAAIERLGPARTVRAEVRRGRWSGPALAALTRARLPAGAMFRMVYGLAPDALPPCDIIVSAGAETLAASIWLARSRSVPNIYYGSLRLFSPLDFSLVLTSYASYASRPRHAVTLKPSRFDPDAAPGPTPAGGTAATHAGLLIGGDAGPITYSTEDWDRLLSFVAAAHARTGQRWLIANSRRTPQALSDDIAALAAKPAGPVETFLDVRSAGPGSLASMIARCDVMVCTADSSSMLSECIWARRPSLAVTPSNFQLDAAERGYRDWLAGEGWCAECPIAGLEPDTLEQLPSTLRPLTESPQVALAALIQAKIPELREVQRVSR